MDAGKDQLEGDLPPRPSVSLLDQDYYHGVWWGGTSRGFLAGSLFFLKKDLRSEPSHSAASLAPRFFLPPSAFASTGARNLPV
jgi:hypothetical protein